MLTSEHPSLSSFILEQYSAGGTSYRSYREVSYAQQSDTRNEPQPVKTSLRIYDRQVDDIVTVLIDVIIDISLYSVTRNDETIHHTETWNNVFMNHLLSETARITTSGSRFPICYDICKLQTSFRFTTHTYVSAPTCVDLFVIMSRARSLRSILRTLIFILCTLKKIPNNPMPTPLPRQAISNQSLSGLAPISLQVSSRQTRDWCRQLRYRVKCSSMRREMSYDSHPWILKP